MACVQPAKEAGKYKNSDAVKALEEQTWVVRSIWKDRKTQEPFSNSLNIAEMI
jgi:hypothetical protein